ncbi:histone-lysine N-methyltransferase SETMAR [Trichonephila clavipes]|nr:histone-lysine N-methyltransferase SETMAR [Trichonephila clavipes]
MCIHQQSLYYFPKCREADRYHPLRLIPRQYIDCLWKGVNSGCQYDLETWRADLYVRNPQSHSGPNETIQPIVQQSYGFGWDVFGHPSYSPDLTPSDFHLFLHLKSFLAGKHFNNDKELKENVSNWLKTQAATFYEEGIEKLVPRYDTCLQNFGSYVER